MHHRYSALQLGEYACHEGNHDLESLLHAAKSEEPVLNR
jgi:hypothetical protein